MADAKKFITLLQRASHSRYKSLLMNNRMIIQCYNVDVDSDIGLHYVLPIPDTPDYEDAFFNSTLMVSPSEITTAYTEMHREMDALRKEKKLKPKDLVEEVYLIDGILKFVFTLLDEGPATITIPVEVPTDLNPDVMNILKHYNDAISRIRAGGVCIEIDGTYSALQSRVVNTPEIMFYIMRYGGKKVRVPLYKSMFLGIKDVDTFQFNIQETDSDELYLHTVKIRKGDIEEIFWGYIMNF